MNSNDRSFEIAIHSDLSVLISGETGTGKSYLARQIHEQSLRQKGPFIELNLATLHEGLLEAELFGHEKGAFTGAHQKRIGRLEMAQNGTLFLDEIAELSLPLQARLLDFLQYKRLFPLGSNQEKNLDVRIITASHQNLLQKIKNGSFRQDLFYRLRMVEMILKPLRERTDEIQQYVHQFNLQNPAHPLLLSEEVLKLFQHHPWPGNIRELENLCHYLRWVNPQKEILPCDLPPWFFAPPLEICKNQGSQHSSYENAFNLFEEAYFQSLYEKKKGKIQWMLQESGMTRSTLVRKLKKQNLL